MSVQVSATDERVIEVVAAVLPIHHGAQLAVDITLRSAVTSVGAPRTTAATVNGAALSQARRDKEAKNAELVASERCRLVAVAMETGGRFVMRETCLDPSFFLKKSQSSERSCNRVVAGR